MAEYDFTYTAADGYSLSLTITTSDTETTVNSGNGDTTGYAITAISGSITTPASAQPFAIAGLVSVGGFEDNDNLYVPGNSIDLSGLSFTAADGNSYNLFYTSSPAVGFPAGYNIAGPNNSVISENGTFSSTSVCFVTGTLILTTRGEVAVEDLAVGDLAVSATGEARPIRWIGRKRVERPRREQWPVRVMAGAFGDGLPARDLFLSPGHAVCVDVMDVVFVPVGQLINGATIAQVEVSDVTYWHVELESHDMLLAEGLPAESYMDAGNRQWFGREYGRLETIDPARIAESLTRYVRPFVDRGPLVEAIRARLTARAETLGWTQTSDMDLHLVAGGRRIEPTIDGDLARFVLPAAARTARLVSRTFVPGADRRELGIRIKGLIVSDGLRLSRDVPLDVLSEGVYGLEHDGQRPCRWTNGDTVLPATLWEGCNGLAVLTIAFNSKAGRSWIAPQIGTAVHRAA